MQILTPKAIQTQLINFQCPINVDMICNPRDIYTKIQKSQMKRALLLIIVLSCLLLATLSDEVQPSKTISTLQMGKAVEGMIYKEDHYRNFHTLRINELEQKYLFISVTVEDIFKHLPLVMYIYEGKNQTPMKKCNKQEIDSCYIPNYLLRMNETYFIIVQSQDQEQLSYQIKTYWSNLEHIIPNQEIRFMFSEKEQRQVYHLELKGKEFKELKIIIKPETRRYPFDKVKMYGKFGNESYPSSTDYDFKSFPLWEDSQGIFFFKSQLKQLNMNLILYGVTETIYTMRCELSNNTHNDLTLNNKIYEYLQKGERYMYHVVFKDKDDKFFFQEYELKISIFTGDLDIKFYKDENKEEELDQLSPAAYMGDMKHIITQDLAEEMPNGLYIEAFSPDRISTFLMNFKGKKKDQALELQQHIYDFARIDKQQKAFFKVGRFDKKQSANDSSLSFTFSEISVQGKVAVQFRACNKSTIVCLGSNLTEQSKKLKYSSGTIGTKTTYTVELPSQLFSNVNLVEQNVIIIVIISSIDPKQSTFSAIEYSIGNRPEFLRENKPMESHVKRQELKVYKYVCQDPNVRKIRVHVNKHFGNFQAFAYQHLPDQLELQESKGKILGKVVEFTQNLTGAPIVIIIHGSDYATFSIVVQPVVQSQQKYSFVTLSEDVEFKAKVAPNQFQIFEIVPIEPSIFFSYKATGELHVCLLNDEWVCVGNDTIPKLSNKDDIKIDKFYARKAYVRVRNPSSSRVVEITSIFHSKLQQFHCELAQVGVLTNAVVKQGACLYTNLASIEDHQVLIVHQQFCHFQYKMSLCDKLITLPHKENSEERYTISKAVIQKSCKGHQIPTFVFSIASDLQHLQEGTMMGTENKKFKFIVQKVDGIIQLPDGVGYKGKVESKASIIKKFSYRLLNPRDTDVTVTTRSKLFFLAKVVESKYKQYANISLRNNDFASPMDRFYFLQSLYLKIDQSWLKKRTCVECELLIFVFSKQPAGSPVQFTIEVTQNFMMLEEATPRSQYLTQNSMAYYGYEAKQKGYILVELSDNNKDCTQIYMSHNQFPDENNYGQKTFDGHMLFQNTKDKVSTYYITVKAKKNCAYSISTNLVTKQTVLKLERGKLSRLSMKEGEVKYFTFKYLSDSYFKILSLHKYGNVRFYLNKTTHEQIIKLMKGQKIELSDFQLEGEKKNRLILYPSSKMFCPDCLYLLAVQARRNTESSLYLGDEDTKIPISEEKVINDILPEAGSLTLGEFYPIEKGTMQVKIHSGKIQVQVEYKDQKFQKGFQKTSGNITLYNFTLTLVKGYYGTATITIVAKTKNTVYSMRIRAAGEQRKEDATANYQKVEPSEANYIYVYQKPTCLQGYLKKKDEKVFVSFYAREKEIMRNLTVTCKLNDKESKVIVDSVGNVMAINFPGAEPLLKDQKVVNYEVCLGLQNNSFSAAVMQTEETGLLPEDTEMLVMGKQTYDIYPQGPFLLDVFECRGSASVSYGSSRKQLEEKKQKVLDSIGMPDQPHAVKIDKGYSNLLLRVKAELAVIRWLPINEDNQMGLGYYLYAAGSMSYDSAFKEVSFTVEPIKLAKKNIKTKTKIVDIKYNLYVSNSQDDIVEASLCERYLPDSVMEFQKVHEEMYRNSFTFGVRKGEIMGKYKNTTNLYAVIVADLTLKTPGGKEQSYRFIYNNQEMPADVFTPTVIESANLILIIVILAGMMGLLLLFAYLCKNVFVPMIGRLKNRMLVEENAGDKSGEKDSEPVPTDPPPSSDRQNINALRGPETEDRM